MVAAKLDRASRRLGAAQTATYFRIVGVAETERNFVYAISDSRALTTPLASGPWNPQHQHGAAPTSLICWAIERIPTREPMQVARITVDLLRPVPIASLDIKTSVVREGRKIQLCSAQLFAEGVEVARASVLKIRSVATPLPESVHEETSEFPGPEASRIPKRDPEGTNLFTAGVDMRFAKGGFRRPGPAAAWFRAVRPIVSGEGISPLMRAAIASDFCNGVSSPLDFREWTFINGDLTLNLARMPVDDWVLLDAQSYIGADGVGVAFARLGDSQGFFGRAAQSLVLERRSLGPSG
jgi:hypothetical protein